MKPEFIVVFVVVYTVVILPWLFRKLSGWERMEKKYRTTQSPPQQMTRFSGGRVGLSSFRGVLGIGVNSQGLYLCTLFPFSLFLRPLFIPWSEIIEVEKRDRWLAKTYYFRVNTKPITVLQFPQYPFTSVEGILLQKQLSS